MCCKSILKGAKVLEYLGIEVVPGDDCRPVRRQAYAVLQGTVTIVQIISVCYIERNKDDAGVYRQCLPGSDIQ